MSLAENLKQNSVCKQDTDKVLLVEGDTDCHVVMALCQAHNIPETFGIYQCGSDDGVLKRLNALITRPNPPQVIGVMLDADNPSLEGRWKSIAKKLQNYSYELYQFTKVWQHFCELKPKLCKGFKNTKSLRPFMFWYYLQSLMLTAQLS
ncbi:MAG: DUF3226 domain-containing protein [Pseudanabaena sp.]